MKLHHICNTPLKACAITLALLTCACATTPTPAEICSAEWIKPRTTAAMKEIKRDTSGTIKKLVKAANTMASGEKLSTFQQFSMMSSVNGLKSKFETSQALKDLKTISSTCNDPTLIKDTFTGFLAEFNAPPNMVSLVEGFLEQYSTRAASSEDTNT